MISNVTRNTIVAIKHNTAVKLLDKTLGLLKKPANSSLIIKTRFGIHTFGMKNPLDIMILDKKNKVVYLKENLSPHRIFVWNPKFDTVIEIPMGSIKQSNTGLGDMLVLE